MATNTQSRNLIPKPSIPAAIRDNESQWQKQIPVSIQSNTDSITSIIAFLNREFPRGPVGTGPMAISLSQTANAIRVAWTRDNSGATVDYYSIWRNTTNDLSTALRVAVVPSGRVSAIPSASQFEWFDENFAAADVLKPTTFYYWVASIDNEFREGTPNLGGSSAPPYVASNYFDGSTAGVAGGYASDTTVAGSIVQVPVGAWRQGTIYHCAFDMTKTAAGSAATVLTLRAGPNTGSPALAVLTFGAGTAAADSGVFDVYVNFRSVGSGTSAVVQFAASCSHHLAATGLISTGASGFGMVTTTSAGFDSTTFTTLSVSFNGGASFSGTNTFVQANLNP